MKKPLVLALVTLVLSLAAGVTPALASAPRSFLVTAAAAAKSSSAPAAPKRALPGTRVNQGAAAAALPGTTSRRPSAAAGLAPAVSAALPAVGSSWTSLGPKPIVSAASVNAFTYGNVSGRVTSIAVDPATPTTVWAGSAGGGVWKSTDSGVTWLPMTDGAVSGGIGAIAIDPTNSQIVYAATGEDNACTDICPPSRGILKTVDGGATWSLVGASTFDTAPSGVYFFFGSIAVDRITHTSLVAATNQGLYTSADSGVTWMRNGQLQTVATVLPPAASANGAVMQAIQDPASTFGSNRWYAAVSDWCTTEGGDVMESTNGGTTWAISKSFGDPFIVGGAERISIAVGPNSTVYAEVSGCTSPKPSGGNGPYRLQGVTWTNVGEAGSGTNVMDPPNGGGAQGFWDNTIAVDPANASSVLVGGVTVISSPSSGSSGTWTDVGQVYSGSNPHPIHPDFHAFAFTASGGIAYAANDGGIWKTSDLGVHWTNLNATLQLTQYYAGFSKDLSTFAGGSQDNGTSGRYPSAPAAPALGLINGGDGGWAQFRSGTQYYTESQFNDMQIVDTSGLASNPNNATENGPCINPGSTSQIGPSCSDRTAFITPFVASPGNTDRLYVGTYRVWRSTSGGLPSTGASYGAAISTDLTAAGGTDTLTQMTIRTIGGHDVVVTASQAGKVFMSTSAEAPTPTWTDITGNLPARTAGNSIPFNDFVSAITINPANASEIWVAIGSITAGVGRVYHTTNAGSATTWTDLTGSGAGGLPVTITKSIAVNPNFPTNLIVGTDAGAYICFACGGTTAAASWSQLGTGLPNARINQLSVTDDGMNVFAWTHGRGVWTMPLPLDTLVLTTSAANPDVAGTSLTATVTAKRPDGPTDAGYRDAIHFTSTDASATVPGDYTFGAGDAGVHAFTGVVLKTAGSQTITATDTAYTAITATSAPINVSPASTSQLAVAAPASAAAYVSFSFSVTAKDAYGNTTPSYSGTVHFTSSDASAASLPANSALTSGAGTFSATLATAGNQTITATDTGTASITGTSGAINVSAAPPSTVGFVPSSLSFNSQMQGTTSSSQTVTLTNNGIAPLHVTTVALTGTGAGGYQKGTDTCAGQTIASNATCTVQVSFSPATFGNFPAALTFTDDGSSSPQSVALSGQGTLDNRLTYESLGGALSAGPASSSWGPNHLDVFVRGTDGALYHKSRNGSTWTGYEFLGGGMIQDPAAVSTAPNRIDVFIRGLDNQLWHMSWSGTAWSSWEPLGGSLGSGPAVTAPGGGRLEVFARGSDNSLQHRSYSGTAWSPWESLGGIITTDPTVVSTSTNTFDVFARGNDNQLWRTAWTGTAWTGWAPLGGILTSGPDGSSCTAGHLDILVIGADHALWRLAWNGSQWSGWQSLGGLWLSDPSTVCQPGATTADMFGEGADRALWHGTFLAA